MEKRSAHYGDVQKWVEKVINSCETHSQLISARILVQNFESQMRRNKVDPTTIYRIGVYLINLVHHKMKTYYYLNKNYITMTGTLIKKDGEWVVKHIKDGSEYLYPLCPKTTDWTLRKSTQSYIKEGIEVIFTLMVKGEYCETKEMLLKNYQAKIVSVNHETI